MEPDRRRTLSAAFGAGGAGYEQLRPGYPGAALDWLTDGIAPGAEVADLGAGTGKLSRSLLERGFRVTAVDPSADMLAQLSSSGLPGLSCRIGTGEATGLPRRSVALATFAQSWHWVEPTAGFAELRRILRPGGRVGWVWNFVDVRVDWVRELSGIWHSLTAGEVTDPDSQAPVPGHGFGPLEATVVEWTAPMTTADLASLVTTRSYYLSASESERQRVRAEVGSFLHREFGSVGRVSLPYRTSCYRTEMR